MVAAGQAGVAAKMLEKLVRGGETFPAVRIAGDPVAHVRPAPGQRGRVGERRGCHGAERRQRHRETVLLMVALRAPARAASRAHHQLRAVHAVLAARAVRILADRDQRLSAGGRLHAGVAQIRISTRGGARRITEEGGRGGVMMRERRRAGERRSERRIFRQSGWTAQRISRESCESAGLVRGQIGILGMAAGKNLHAGSNDRARSIVVVVVVVVVVIVVVAVAARRSVGFLPIRRCLAIGDGRRGARRGRRLTRGRGRLSTDGRTISRRLFLRRVITRTHTTTLLTTDTVNTSFGSRSTLVGGRLLRDDVSLVRFKRQRLPVRRAAACTPFQLGGWWRFRIRTGIHAFGRFIQRGNQRLCRRIGTYLTACLSQ